MADRDTAGQPTSPSASPLGALCAVFAAAAIIGTEPLGELVPYAAYLPLSVAFVVQVEGRLQPAARRLIRIVPLLAILALGLPLSRVLDLAIAPSELTEPGAGSNALLSLALSLFMRALCAVTLVSALIHGYGFSEILAALRRLGLPTAVLLTLEHMERYRTLIAEEWRRTRMARECRSPGGGRFAFASYANQAGLVFLRSWERSERVHVAMLSRGFEIDPAVRRSTRSNRRASWRGMLAVAWLPAIALVVRLAV